MPEAAMRVTSSVWAPVRRAVGAGLQGRRARHALFAVAALAGVVLLFVHLQRLASSSSPREPPPRALTEEEANAILARVNGAASAYQNDHARAVALSSRVGRAGELFSPSSWDGDAWSAIPDRWRTASAWLERDPDSVALMNDIYYTGDAAGWSFHTFTDCKPKRIQGAPCHAVALKIECAHEFLGFLDKHPRWRGLNVACCYADASFPGYASGTRRLVDVPPELPKHAQVAEFLTTNADDRAFDKVVPMPLGFMIHNGRHTPPHLTGPDRWLFELANETKPLQRRKPRVRADFMFAKGYASGNDRERNEARAQLAGNALVEELRERVSQRQYYLGMAEYQAVVCPPGNGFDTHRLWETLVLGCLAVVKRVPQVEWLERFAPNVVLVDEYSEITPQRLASWVERAVRAGTANKIAYDMLGEYWIARLRQPLDPVAAEAFECPEPDAA